MSKMVEATVSNLRHYVKNPIAISTGIPIGLSFESLLVNKQRTRGRGPD
jgi:hypothetical protein